MTSKASKPAKQTNTEGVVEAGKSAMPQNPSVAGLNQVSNGDGVGGNPTLDASGVELGNALQSAIGAGGDGGLVQLGLDRAGLDRAGWPRTIRVTGPEKGRRRAGRRFGREPVDLEVADLTDEAIISIAGDRELTVVPLEA